LVILEAEGMQANSPTSREALP